MSNYTTCQSGPPELMLPPIITKKVIELSPQNQIQGKAICLTYVNRPFKYGLMYEKNGRYVLLLVIGHEFPISFGIETPITKTIGTYDSEDMAISALIAD